MMHAASQHWPAYNLTDSPHEVVTRSEKVISAAASVQPGLPQVLARQ